MALEIRTRSRAKVRFAQVYYKRMPAYHEWVKIEMEGLGNNRHGVKVPLTPEGILYYFEVADEDGNAANYPDFLKQTPYFAINGWDPARGAAQ